MKHVVVDPGPDTHPAQYYQQQLERATERTIASCEDEVRAAVLLLAYGARVCLPGAKRINLGG
jgi:hypothetical protein